MWGVILLAIFALIYISAAFFAVRNKTVLLALASLVACALTIVSGLSIGILYFPAMLAVVVGWQVLGISRLWRYCFQPFPADQE